MTGATSVIIDVRAGGRPLLRTVEALDRQARRAAALFLVQSEGRNRAPLVDAIASRFAATVVEPGTCPGAALNAAALRANGEYLVVLPAGIELHERFIERCEMAFDGDPGLSAIASVIALRTPDGSGALHWVPEGTSVPAILSDTRSVPAAFAIRRNSWESLGGCDEALEGLVLYEFWLRLALSKLKLSVLQEPLVFRELAAGEAERATDRQRHLQFFRAVVARHAAAIDHDMMDVLVSREIRFGQLREGHRGLLARRDADLQALDRLRADAAHHRAYLTHHDRTAIDWGDLRRVDPVSREWGYDRGEPVDRQYIDEFLASHSSDIRGSVLEVQEDDFTRAYGGARVAESSILDIDAANPRATVLADLRAAPEIPSERFDCIILTQTLHVIDDMGSALRECYRVLRPGGVLLATVPAASRVCLEYGQDGDFWRATPAGVRALFRFAFVPSQTSTSVFGSVLTNTAFLQGFASSELSDREFAAHDPYFPALTGVRARKSDAPLPSSARGVVLLYHRVDEHPDVHELGVPPALFLQHLQWLDAECTLMPLDELLASPAEALPRRPVALTFDDGYVDNLDVAAPLLQQQGAPATFFLTTRWIDTPGEYWWDAVERILLGASHIPPSLKIRIGDGDETLPTASIEERRQAHWRLQAALVHATLDERARLEASLRAWSGSSLQPRVRPMVADEIQRLSALPGITIGAHGVNHLSLPDQRHETRLAEVSQSRADLARIIGKPVDLFAYPYGALDRESAAAVRQSCRWGLSCEVAPLGDAFDAARVPRLDVKRWDVSELASRIDRLFRLPGQSAPRALTLAP